MNIIKCSLSGILALSLVACTTGPMLSSAQPKPGFANITDIPLPESATMDLHKSVVTGAGDTWAGHLVYDTNNSRVRVIDFTSKEMKAKGWSKVSELRGKESVLVFMMDRRVATIRVSKEDGFLSNKTLVVIDMANSNLRNALVNSSED